MNQHQIRQVSCRQKPIHQQILAPYSHQAKFNRLNDFGSQLQRVQCDHLSKYISQFIPSEKYRSSPVKSLPSNPDLNCHQQLKELMVACQELDHTDVQKILSSKIFPYQRFSSKENNPLLYAMKNTSEQACKIINLFAKYFPDLISFKDSDGSTPLHWAIKPLSPKIFKQLLISKVSPNIQLVTSGNTVLHEIILQSSGYLSEPHFQISQMLLQYNANPYIKNKEGKDCFQLSKIKSFGLEEENQKCFKFYSTEQEQKEGSSFSRGQTSHRLFLQQQSSSSEESDEDYNQAFDEILTRQIYKFEQQSNKKKKQAQKRIQQIYEVIFVGIARDLNLQVYKIGSFATGLWVQTSDINIMYTTAHHTDKNFIHYTLKEIYKRLDKKISEKKLFIKNQSKFPKLKVEFPSKHGGWKIDISVFHQNRTGTKCTAFINNYLRCYPQIKSLFFVWHEILVHFKVDSLKKGGLQNYFLFLMIMRVYLTFNPHEKKSLGEMFLETVRIFAEGIPFFNRHSGKNDFYSIFHTQDPLNTENTIQKRTQTDKVSEVFRIIFYGSKNSPKKRIIQYLCQLNKIALEPDFFPHA